MTDTRVADELEAMHAIYGDLVRECSPGPEELRRACAPRAVRLTVAVDDFGEIVVNLGDSYPDEPAHATLRTTRLSRATLDGINADLARRAAAGVGASCAAARV